MPVAKTLPSEPQPAGHGATPEPPEPKSTKDWAEARGNGTDVFGQNVKPKRAKKATKD